VIHPGETLRIQILSPEFNKEYKGDNQFIPELKREKNELVTIWHGRNDIWDWSKKSTISLIDPQGNHVTKLHVPTNLNKTTEGQKQSCLIM